MCGIMGSNRRSIARVSLWNVCRRFACRNLGRSCSLLGSKRRRIHILSTNSCMGQTVSIRNYHESSCSTRCIHLYSLYLCRAPRDVHGHRCELSYSHRFILCQLHWRRDPILCLSIQATICLFALRGLGNRVYFLPFGLGLRRFTNRKWSFFANVAGFLSTEINFHLQKLYRDGTKLYKRINQSAFGLSMVRQIPFAHCFCSWCNVSARNTRRIAVLCQ